jgi:hypothetical protein
MRTSIAEKYAASFERSKASGLLHLLRQCPRFLRDLYENDKAWEALSFLVWETMHVLNLTAIRTLQFVAGPPTILPHNALEETDSLIANAFIKRGLRVARSRHVWRILFLFADRELYGCLHTEPRVLYMSLDGGTSITRIYAFEQEITAIFISSTGTILIGIHGAVYRGEIGGISFTKVISLSSPASFVLFGNGVTESRAQELLIGEYGNISDGTGFRFCGYLYCSNDKGWSWQESDFLRRQRTNKHVHGIWYSSLLDGVLLTDGDNRKRLWLGRRAKGKSQFEWTLLRKHHIQTGGYLSMVEIEENILFGTDYLGGTNWIVMTRDGLTFKRMMIPDPYRRSPIPTMLKRSDGITHEIWACLHNSICASTRCLLMCSCDDGTTWHRCLEYDGTVNHLEIISRATGSGRNFWFSVEFANDYRVYHVCDL